MAHTARRVQAAAAAPAAAAAALHPAELTRSRPARFHGRAHSTSNGTFTVGGLDPRLYTGDFAWAKNVGGGGLYEMPLASITVGGKPVQLARKSAILDSGTNVLLVPTPVYNGIKQAFLGQCQAGAKLKGVCTVQRALRVPLSPYAPPRPAALVYACAAGL